MALADAEPPWGDTVLKMRVYQTIRCS